MTVSYATGCIPDPVGHMRTPWRGGQAAAPPSASLETPAINVLKKHFDQGETSSCTGHAMAATIATAFACAGLPLAFIPSPDGIYRNARCVDRASVHEKLADEGARPNQVVRAVQTFGIRSMQPILAGRWSDSTSAHVNDEPMLEDIAESFETLVIGERAIYARGSQRVADVKTALSSGFPIAVAINGGCEAFQTYSAGVLTGHELAGGNDHYVWLCGYDLDHFIGWNSWSDDWGIDGNFVLDRAALDTLGDLYVVIPKLGA